jgi:hypothetical protein
MTTYVTSQAKETTSILEKASVPVIAGLGLFLRVWGLGSKSFWLDELGVAQAAFQPSLSLALKAANEHIMAMPLDYVIAWSAAQRSQAEAWLRLPEAVWGFITLLVGYQLCLKLSANRRVALFALLMMALSPVLITYSQELRFYAPLIFYFTLSLSLGLEAVRRSRFKDWLIFTVVTLLGIYFHLYTILAVGTVLLWLAAYFRKAEWEHKRNAFALSALVLSVAFLIGMFTFGGVYAERKLSLFMYEPLSTFLLNGLGWWPPVPSSVAGWTFGFLLMGFAWIGIFTAVRKNPRGESALLFYALVLQIVMVISFDILRNYPLFARQIVMLVPSMIYFSARGVEWIIQQISSGLKPVMPTSWLTAAFVALITVAALPALQQYYQTNKGSHAEILSILKEEWHVPERIHVEAGTFEVFSYYWSQDRTNEPLVAVLTPLDYNSTNGWDYPSPAWFIVNYPPVEGTEAALQAAGFIPYYFPSGNTLHPQMLWHRR